MIDLSECMLVATQFIELAKKYPKWTEVTSLPENETAVLLNTVRAAGFDIKAIVPGKLTGNYVDEDKRSTGQTFPINKICFFVAHDQDDKTHGRATQWLDRLMTHVKGPRPQSEQEDELVQFVARETQNSNPLDPIVLTKYGESLLEYPSDRGHARDESTLGSTVGVHELCRGFVDRVKVAKEHDALVCRQCCLRVVFPNTVKTYGDLRRVMKARLEPES